MTHTNPEKNNNSYSLAIPSLVFLSAQAAVIAAGYEYYLNRHLSIRFVLVIISTLALIPIVYFKSVKITGAGCGENNPLRCMSFLLLTALIASAQFWKIRQLDPGGTAVPPRPPFRAEVESISDKRYSREIILKIPEEEGSGNLLAVAHTPKDTALGENDRVEIRDRPKRLTVADEDDFYAKDLLRKGISHRLALHENNFKIIRHEPALREKIRHAVLKNIETIFPPGCVDIIKALYFGNYGGLDKSLINDFKRAGVLHILAASGLHVGIVASIPLFIFGLIRIPRNITLVIAACIILCYFCITDEPVSLLRAVVMFGVFTAQNLFGFERNPVNALFISASIILLACPYDLYSAGFQLSFGATLGILLFFANYKQCLSFLPDKIADAAAVTLAAQVFVMPVILFHMSELNISGILSNPVVVPLSSFLLAASLAANAVSLVWLEAAKALGIVVDLTNTAMCGIVGFISGLDGHFPADAACAVTITGMLLAALPCIPVFKGKKICSLCIAAGFIVLWLNLRDANAARETVSVFRNDAGAAVLYTNGRYASLTGDMPETAGLEQIIARIKSSGARDLAIHIPEAGRKNIEGYTQIVKRCIVKKCSISSSFRMDWPTKQFFRIIGLDTIRLSIHDFPRDRNNIDRTASRLDPESPDQMYSLYLRFREDKAAIR